MLLVCTLISKYNGQVAFFQSFHPQLHLIITPSTYTQCHESVNFPHSSHTHTYTLQKVAKFPHTPIPGPVCPVGNFKMTTILKKLWEKVPLSIRHKILLIYCAIMLLHFCLAEIFCLMLLYMDNMHMMFLHVMKWLYGSVIE